MASKVRMTRVEFCRRKAEWADKKCAEAAESSAPWALKNLRLYQNYASRFWGAYYAALRDIEQ